MGEGNGWGGVSVAITGNSASVVSTLRLKGAPFAQSETLKQNTAMAATSVDGSTSPIPARVFAFTPVIPLAVLEIGSPHAV